jgi:hypothetical protein
VPLLLPQPPALLLPVTAPLGPVGPGQGLVPFPGGAAVQGRVLAPVEMFMWTMDGFVLGWRWLFLAL